MGHQNPSLGRLGPTRLVVLVALLAGLTAAIAGGAPSHGPHPGFPIDPAAPASAPNVIVIMADDVGFASSSTFGGLIPTPTMDQLAINGLIYPNFHTTGLCSPSRAALLTGRNHHAVGFGGVADFARGEPGYNSIMPASAATIGQLLKANGYSTAWFGKNHNVPTWQSGPLGPYNQWASGLGFDYFYGFHGGHTDQFAPMLIENNNAVRPPADPDFILDRAMADHAIEWLDMQRVQGGGKPFLLYYAPGTAHAPLQAPREWLERFRGRFDQGWDAYRAEVFDRQKRVGIIPADARLAPRPPDVPAWDSLTDTQKKVAARLMEAYAGALAFSDNQIGRVMAHLRTSGQLENTLVIFVQGDNGASPEGRGNGTINVVSQSSPADDFTYTAAHLEDIGGPRSYAAIPTGWAVALNTPLPWYKMIASRLGGIRNGMVISWPKGIPERGVRTQFTHLVDILPTVLELSGIRAPTTFNGARQVPFDGVSMAATLRRADQPLPRGPQYFEIAGNAALYQDGWFAASPVRELGREDPAPPALEKQWELYDLRSDSSQTIDLAGRYPDQLKDLRAAFEREVQRNHVHPILADTRQMLLPEMRPEITAQAGTYRLLPSAYRYSEGTFPSINNRSWSLRVDIDVPASGGKGALITRGGRYSGWGLVMLDAVPTFFYRMGSGDAALTRLRSPARLAPGRHSVEVSFTVEGVGYGRGGSLKMAIDGKPVAESMLKRTVPFKFAPEDGTVGWDAGTPLVDEYRPPFAFDGTLHSVTLRLEPSQTPVARGVLN